MMDSSGPASPPARAGLAPRRAPSWLVPNLDVAAAAAHANAYADSHVLVSPQGRQCLRAAATLLETGALDVVPGRPFAWFGPAYPVALAGLAAAGLPPVAAVALLNASATIAVLLLFAALARRVAGRSRAAAVVLFAGLAAHPYMFRMARPDVLVVPACLLVILAAARWTETARRRDLAAAALGCAVATTARYMSIFPLAPIAAWLLHRVLARPGRGRFADAALFLLLGWGPVAAWLLRNRVRTGYLTGMSRTEWREAAASTDLATNLLGTAKTLVLDLFGVRSMGVVALVHGEAPVPHRAATLAVAAVAALALIAAVLVARRAPRAAARASRDPDLDSPGSTRLARLVAVWAATYVVAMVALWTWGNNDPIHTRYVAPLYGFLALLAFRAAERLRGTPGGRVARALLAVLALAILAPNVDKGLRLLGESPGDALIRVSLHGNGDLWMRGLSWDRLPTPP
jgi:hypothetical protein